MDIAKNTGLRVEIGGGIRDMKTAENYLNQAFPGHSRSAAVNNPAFVKEAVHDSGENCVGIDAKNEMVAAEGWLDTSSVHYLELAKNMEQIGVKYIIFTDISKDGTLQGPNMEQLNKISQAVSCHIIASGGIKDINDIIALQKAKIYGAICGKSIYKGTLDLKEAIQSAGDQYAG